MTDQERRHHGRDGVGRGGGTTDRPRGALLRSAVLAAMCVAAVAAAAEAAKRDFRGLAPGMSVAEAEAAAAKNGMACETGFADRTTCRGGDASVVLVTTGRRGNRIFQLQVTLTGHYDGLEMRRKLDGFYGLKATATPHVFDTAAGQQLMLLEVGDTSTVFYLVDPAVLHDDSEPLPPPKL